MRETHRGRQRAHALEVEESRVILRIKEQIVHKVHIDCEIENICTSGIKSEVSRRLPLYDIRSLCQPTCSYVRQSPITPTDLTGSNTTKACPISLYTPAAVIS